MGMTSTSQAGQDLFAWTLSGKIRQGGFVDLGCNDATFHSNSAGLEAIGWVGVLVDIAPVCSGRRSPFECCDATKPSPRLLELYSALPPVLGYLSVDCDESTLGALLAFPHDKVVCQTITVETDRYRLGDGPRNEIREFLIGRGYDLVCADVICPGYGEFEDFWAHPHWSSSGVRDSIRCKSTDWREIKL
jgi:hypothetical protein